MTAEVQELVSRARNGDRQAWDALVSRFAPMIWSICRKYGLGEADAGDAGQSVWLHLVDHLDRVRDPAALPGWLATTTRRECRVGLGEQISQARPAKQFLNIYSSPTVIIDNKFPKQKGYLSVNLSARDLRC